MEHTLRSSPSRKAKKTYTLSPESVAFLEALRKRRKSASASSVLEEILQMVRREQERATLERDVASYYDSLSPGETKEQADWGEFATREFPNREV